MTDARVIPKHNGARLPSSAAPGADQGDGVLDLLGAFIFDLWRRRVIIGTCVVLGLALALYIAFTTEPSYRARAVVTFDVERPDLLDEARPVATGPSPTVLATEMLILTSRNLLGRVVDQLNLVDDPEFNYFLRERDEPIMPSLTDLARRALFGAEDNQRVYTPDADIVRQHVIRALSAIVRVGPIGSSYAFGVTVEAGDPRKAALLANTIAEIHIEDVATRSVEAAITAERVASERIAELQQSLRQAEAEVSLRRAEAPPRAEEDLAALERRIGALRTTADVVEGRRADATARLTRLLAAIEDGDQAAALQALDTDWMAARRRQLETASDAWLAQSDAATRAALDAALQAAVAELQTVQRESDARAQTIRAELTALSQTYDDQSAQIRELREYESRAAALRGAYESLLARVQQRVSGESAGGSQVRIISPAVAPVNPFAPRKQMLVVFGLLGGGVVGTGLAVLANAIQPTINSARAARRVFDRDIFAQAPAASRGELADMVAGARRRPASPVAAAFRGMAAGLTLRFGQGGVYVVTAPSGREGGSVVAAGVTQAFAKAGYNVVLLRCHPSCRGRSDGDASWRERLRLHKGSGAHVLDISPPTTSLADYFGRPEFAAILSDIRESFDVVLIDAPPVLASSDALFLARHSTAVLLVVRLWKTGPDAARDAQQALSATRMPFELVVNHG